MLCQHMCMSSPKLVSIVRVAAITKRDDMLKATIFQPNTGRHGIYSTLCAANVFFPQPKYFIAEMVW